MKTSFVQEARSRTTLGIAFLAIALWAGGCAKDAPPPAKPAPPAPVAEQPSAGQGTDLTVAVIRVAKEALPAVVHIEVTEHREVANPLYPFRQDPFMQRFFGGKNMPKQFKQDLMALGSGMIVDVEGHILTNGHVVEGANEIQVFLSNGDKHPGKVVGIDPKTDLAVVQIPGDPSLPHVTLGDSDAVEVGEWVVAIGAPRGLYQTVTQGIISAKHRHGITDPSSYEDFLQTDAAINPGNSGGPLFNLKGEVIGINSMIASTSGGSEGIGFAIPSNMATYISQQLIAHGKVERGWMGVSIQLLTPELARSLGLPNARGALVSDVLKGGPADQAGVKRGDVVVTYRGEAISDSDEFRNKVASTPVGESVVVKVLRKGEPKDLTVKIGDLAAATKVLVASVQGRLGVTVRAITPEETSKYGLEPGQGVVITSVEPKGPLGEQGFEVDDVILEIGGQPMTNVDTFVSVVGSLPPGQGVAVLALDHRTGNTGYVKVDVR
jgi:serine protease Do